MSQTQAERLQAERKLAENQFDITQYDHVPRRYYGRIFFATVIVIAIIGLVRAFAEGKIEWSYIGQFLTSQAIMWACSIPSSWRCWRWRWASSSA